MRANNDPLEGMFGCLGEAFQKCKGAGMAELAGEDKIHVNGDMRRGTYAYVTGKRRQAEIDGDDDESPVLGMFHEMLPELIDMLEH